MAGSVVLKRILRSSASSCVRREGCGRDRETRRLIAGRSGNETGSPTSRALILSIRGARQMLRARRSCASFVQACTSTLLGFRPDCEEARCQLVCCPGLFPCLAALRLRVGTGVRGNPGPTPWQGHLNLGTLTAVASLGSRLWVCANNSGHGSRSGLERVEKKQRRCFWKTQATSASCRSASPGGCGLTA